MGAFAASVRSARSWTRCLGWATRGLGRAGRAAATIASRKSRRNGCVPTLAACKERSAPSRGRISVLVAMLAVTPCHAFRRWRHQAQTRRHQAQTRRPFLRGGSNPRPDHLHGRGQTSGAGGLGPTCVAPVPAEHQLLLSIYQLLPTDTWRGWQVRRPALGRSLRRQSPHRTRCGAAPPGVAWHAMARPGRPHAVLPPHHRPPQWPPPPSALGRWPTDRRPSGCQPTCGPCWPPERAAPAPRPRSSGWYPRRQRQSGGGGARGGGGAD